MLVEMTIVLNRCFVFNIGFSMSDLALQHVMVFFGVKN